MCVSLRCMCVCVWVGVGVDVGVWVLGGLFTWKQKVPKILALPGWSPGCPKPTVIYNLPSPMGCTWSSSTGSCPRGILVRCPNHLTWLLQGSLWISKLFILWWKVSPAILFWKPYFHQLYLQPHSFCYYPQLMTIGKDRDIDWLVNRNLLLHRHRLVHWL